MTFLSPLWLIGLLPWAAVTVYLLWGRRRQEPVPFLNLWMGPVKGPRPRRRIAAPPVALALAILAMLLAVLAAAAPAWTAGRPASGVTVVVDRGATMSAWGDAGPRFAEVSRAVAAELRRHGGATVVQLVAVPGGPSQRLKVDQVAPHVDSLPRTAIVRRDALQATVRRVMAQTAGPVVVVSDHPPGVEDERLVRVAPDRPVRNGGIALLAARLTPSPQVMVRVVATPAMTGAAAVEVDSGGATAKAEVTLPPGGGKHDVFVDLPALGDVVSARLRVEDDFEADDVAWVIREGSPPRVEPRVELAPALRRMVDVYARARPADEGAQRVVVVNEPPELRRMPGVVLPGHSTGTRPTADVRTVPHPVTRHLPPQFPESVRLAPAPGPGWTPLVTVAGETAVAVREQPARQVWVGMDSPAWAREPGYVVFWTNIFDWVGGGSEATWVSHPVGTLTPAWKPTELPPARGNHAVEAGGWPGIYERTEDGARRALNAGPIPIPSREGQGSDWRARLPTLLAAARAGGGTPLAPWLLTGALACLAGAAMSWKGRNLTAFSAGRSVPG